MREWAAGFAGPRYGSEVGFYREQVLPRLVDRACSTAGMTSWRAAVTDGLEGRVVEIGFGSGLNLEHYPPAVEVVLAVEPAAVARRLAVRRIASSRVPVEHVGLDGQSIALADASIDAALSTFWQRRLEPLQRRLADGCHLTRDIPALIADAGFLIERVEQRYAKGPRPWSWFSVGVAANPG